MALATAQHGAVTTAQLVVAGLSPWAIRRRVAQGWLRRLHRGVYLVGTVATPLTGPSAAVLACGAGAALVGQSAAARWALMTEPEVPEVGVDRDVRSRHGLVVRRTTWAPGDVVERHGLPVTSPQRTLADLRRLITSRDHARVAEEAEVRGLIPRGTGRDPSLTRSEAERRLLELIRAARLPRPVTNARLGHYEVDFLWPAQKLVVEVDGFAFHSSRAAFERDRARDAELQAAGYRVLRFTWRQITREPHVVVARLATALAN